MSGRADSIVVRALNSPGDLATLQRFDIGFVTDAICEVRREPRGFSLVERSVEPPLRKSYVVHWGEIEAADATLVAEIGDTPVGVACLDYQRWNRRAVITHFYVDAAARGQGAGSRLLRELRSRASILGARALFVETQCVNLPAVRFYERHGFALVGLDTSLYDPKSNAGETALYFELALETARH